MAVCTYSGCNLTAMPQCLSKWHLTFSKKYGIDSKPEVSGSVSRYFIEPKKAIKQNEPTTEKSLTAKRNGMLRASFSQVLGFSVFPSQLHILLKLERRMVFSFQHYFRAGFTILHYVWLVLSKDVAIVGVTLPQQVRNHQIE